MKRKRPPLAAALALALAACAPRPWRLGPLGDAAAPLGPVGAPPRASLALAPVVDARPALERRGRRAPRARGPRGDRGGYEIAAEAPRANLARELAPALRATLAGARVARAPRPGARANYALAVRVEHLYATRRAPAAGDPGPAAPLVYGNAGLDVTLFEGGAPGARPVWRERVAGAAALRDDAPGAGDRARREALREALGRLARRLGGALDRLGRGPSVYGGPARAAAPAVFLVERVSRTRDLLETLYVDAAAAAVVRHEVTALGDPSYGRPGEWLLARRTVEGLWLPHDAYEALARALAPAYDLRALDDAERYHFFGPREPPPPAAPGRR